MEALEVVIQPRELLLVRQLEVAQLAAVRQTVELLITVALLVGLPVLPPRVIRLADNRALEGKQAVDRHLLEVLEAAADPRVGGRPLVPDLLVAALMEVRQMAALHLLTPHWAECLLVRA